MDKIVWKPTDEYIEKANITRFMKKYDIKVPEMRKSIFSS